MRQGGTEILQLMILNAATSALKKFVAYKILVLIMITQMTLHQRLVIIAQRIFTETAPTMGFCAACRAMTKPVVLLTGAKTTIT